LVSQAEDDTAGVLLLEDLRRHFEAEQTDRLRTADIVSALGSMEERPWSEWSKGKPITARQIAKLLAPFSIHPKTIKVASMETAKGYLLEDCHDAFSRYLGNVSVTPSPPSSDTAFRTNDSVTDALVVTDEKCSKPASNQTGYVVTDAQPDAEEEGTYDWTQEVGDDADTPC
jgi:putative DNA primase/helicase